jgi:SAM-dependent methyltransferase
MQLAALRAFGRLERPRRDKILDAPCGDGSLAATLRSAGYDVCGVDIDGAAQECLGPAYYDADLNERLPFEDDAFDVAFSIEGIEHLENRYKYLRELHRVLKPRGMLILTTPNIVGLRSRVRFFGSAFYHRDGRPLREAQPSPFHHIALSTLADLRYALHTCGFRLGHVGHTHIKPVSYLYCWLVPWMWLYTLIAFRKEKDPLQRRANREIRSALFSRSVLFGENLLLVARKVQGSGIAYSGVIEARPQSSHRK